MFLPLAIAVASDPVIFVQPGPATRLVSVAQGETPETLIVASADGSALDYYLQLEPLVRSTAPGAIENVNDCAWNGVITVASDEQVRLPVDFPDACTLNGRSSASLRVVLSVPDGGPERSISTEFPLWWDDAGTLRWGLDPEYESTQPAGLYDDPEPDWDEAAKPLWRALKAASTDAEKDAAKRALSDFYEQARQDAAEPADGGE